MKIGITERGDAGLNFNQINWSGIDGAILITKAPHILFQNIEKIPIPYIVHCNITGFAGTVLEPNVANINVTLKAYRDFLDRIPQDRVILRIDPIIPTEKGLRTAEHIIKNAQGRVRISFIDQYAHLVVRFQKHGIKLPWDSFHAPIEIRKNALDRLKQTHENIETCGEPGLPCFGCVSQTDITALGLNFMAQKGGHQREQCTCIAEKTEMLNQKKPCGHKCLYCYWQDK